MIPPPTPAEDQAWRQMLAYLDGTLPPDEVRQLNELFRQDEGLRSAFADLLVQEIKLKELGEEAALAAEDAAASMEPAANVVPLMASDAVVPVEPPAVHRPPAYRRWARVVLPLAASVALAGALWSWMQPARLARLTALEGGLTVERGERIFAAAPGEILRAGDRLRTLANSRASFRYLGEETEVGIEAETRLKLDLEQPHGKRLQLDRGTLEAVVARQQPNAPLRLATPQAEAVVVGTRFKLLASDTVTRLEVFEGAVSIGRETDHAPVLAAAGKGVTVAPGQPLILQDLSESRGTILLEHWDGTAGGTNQTYLGQFMFSGVGVKPGSSRARGYLHPPRSGAYSFHVAGSGQTELWLSDSADPARARRVWSSGETSTAAVVAQLRTDQRYYLELRCTSESEPAAFTLSWTTPGGQQRVIYGDYLSPFSPAAVP